MPPDSNHPLKAAMGTYWVALQSRLKGGNPKPEEWQPFYQCFIDQVNEALQKKSCAVVTFAVLGCFEGEIEWLAQKLPGVKMVEIKVERKVLMDRFHARNKVIIEKSGVTEA